ncbi:MAG: TIGR03767 family metallophosphoesterase, partial [Actinobacteria bacterium]|nr:TIGR03767 family metallophosphoesterase [Actinomycetota bacterium]
HRSRARSDSPSPTLGLMLLSRRAFLQRAGVLAAAGLADPDLLRARERAWGITSATTASPSGTTLESTLVPVGTGYRRFIEAPGWPTRVRTLGPEAMPGRHDRRVPLAAIVHLTDIHIIDTESPSRVEFLDRYSDPPLPDRFKAAFRPQETLTAQVAESMVRRVNSLAGGPITGRPFDCAVSTGDNGDNRQENELAWFITLLDGGRVAASSGGPRYEGVQDQEPTTYDRHYWHPDDLRSDGDFYKQFHGFPSHPGLLAAAAEPFTASGLQIPWYTTYGNHDGLAQGTASPNPAFEAISTGPIKVVDLPAGMSPVAFLGGLQSGNPSVLAALAEAPARVVTPDARRRYLSPQEWAQLHLASPARPGPVGHGLPATAATSGLLHYTFDVAPAVVGISLDTVDRGGLEQGSLDPAQFAWLEDRLEEHSSRYFDSAGTLIRTSATDRLIVVFSHHNLETMNNETPDPTTPGRRVLGPAVKALLQRFPNVIAWVNGHSHRNQVLPHPHPRSGGFWEIMTAAHVDYPSQARLVEIVDNRDGTLSLFGTLIDHLAPAVAATGATGLLDLASLSRELSANDYQRDHVKALGTEDDLNVELLVAAPFQLTSVSTPSAVTEKPAERRAVLPATGADRSVGLGVGAAALAGAIALRQRRPTVAAQDQ